VRIAGRSFRTGRVLFLLAGLAVALLVAGLESPLQHVTGPSGQDLGRRPALAAAAVLMMAIWWVTEALPITVTALVPLLVFPLTGVFGRGFAGDLAAAARPYADAYIFLFLGGMALAAAMQEWHLDRRIALRIMRVVGAAPRRLLLGFILATAFVSLWISNTATAAMMFPIGMAVIATLEAEAGRRLAGYGAAVMLAIAYGANVGGVGTKIGTATNALFAGYMAQNLGIEISFARFAAVGLPFVLLFLPLVWWRLWRVGRADAPATSAGRATLEHEIARLGPLRSGEFLVALVFLGAVVLWIGSAPLTRALGPGLAALFPGVRSWSKYVEAGIAMAAALVLLAVPVGGRPALPLRALGRIPWGTLVLLGGGFAMAAGIEASGLSRWMGEALGAFRSQGAVVQVAAASFATVGLTAIASNTATVGVMLNVLAGAAAPGNVLPVLSAVALAASCDFALPAGTPPNAIVFGSGYVTIPRMARTGIVLDVLAALLVTAWCALGVRYILPAI
jgi:sodium-dependent dicarboxylate transporter 2/3/5